MCTHGSEDPDAIRRETLIFSALSGVDDWLAPSSNRQYVMRQRIEYDAAKDARNVAIRGLSFAEVRDFQLSTAVVTVDERRQYGETRYRALGFLGNRLHMLIFTRVDGVLRVISFRKANNARSHTMHTQQPQPDLIDDDSPEWTAEDFARARPASEVIRELFPKDVADALLAPRLPRPVPVSG